MSNKENKDKTFDRINNLPEQMFAEWLAEKTSEGYSKLTLLRAVVNFLPWGGSADVILTARAQAAFEGQILKEIEELQKIFQLSQGDIRARLAAIEDLIEQSSGDWIDESVDLKYLSSTYVPPTEYAFAHSILREKRRLIITGPPHIGKSTTALQLATEIKSAENLKSIVRLQAEDDWRTWEEVQGIVIILDDIFGAVRPEPVPNNWANNWDRITSKLSQKNYVIVTSRFNVLEQTKVQTKLGEDGNVSTYSIELHQEGSYSDEKLQQILENHLNIGRREDSAFLISTEQYEWAVEKKWEIIRKLRFPHNVERFCTVYLPHISRPEEIEQAVDNAREIKNVVQRWVEELPPTERWFVFTVTLFPQILVSAIDKIYRQTAEKLNFTPDSVGHLITRHSAYIADTSRPSLRHPSYHEAAIEILNEKYKWEVGQIVDYGLKTVLESDLSSFSRCIQADYGWPRPSLGSSSGEFAIDPYLEQLSNGYAFFRNELFVGLKPILEPCHFENGEFVAVLSNDMREMELLIMPSDSERFSYQIFQSSDSKKELDRFFDWARKEHVPLWVESLVAYDISQRSPYTHAIERIKNQIDHIFHKQRLPEPTIMRMLRWEKVLKGFVSAFMPSNRYFDIDPKLPFREAEYEALCQQFLKIFDGPTPQDWHPEAWENRKREWAKNFFRLQRLMNAARDENRFYEGAIIPAKDRIEEGYGLYATKSYSPERFREVINFALSTIMDSYRWIVDNCFPSLRSKMWRYNCKVICGVIYSEQNLLGQSHIAIHLLPESFLTKNNQQFEIYIEERAFSANTDINDIVDFSPTLRERLDLLKQHSLTIEYRNPYDFCYGERIIEIIYKWVKNDLDRVLGWKNVGQKRSHHLLTKTAEYVEAENAITGQNILPAVNMQRFVDPWEIEDWER